MKINSPLFLFLFTVLLPIVCVKAFEGDSTITVGDYTKTPYPRIGMLWAAVRGE